MTTLPDSIWSMFLAEGLRRNLAKSKLLLELRTKPPSARGRATKKHHSWVVSQSNTGKGVVRDLATLMLLNSPVDFLSPEYPPPWNGTEEEKKSYYLKWRPLIEQEVQKELRGDMDRAMWLGINRKDKNYTGPTD